MDNPQKSVNRLEDENMEDVTKWDLFKEIDAMPSKEYKKIKEFLERIRKGQEVELEETDKQEFEKAMRQYADGEYMSFDEVFGEGE
ncbi:MAG: hypothetical protein ACE3JP_08880 [Ectobacillus sp.]